MIELSDFRSLYPHIQKGVIYLNHAAVSPLSTKVWDAVNTHLYERSKGAIDSFPQDLEVMEDCRNKIAKLIHTNSDRVTFAPNTSEALNTIAGGLSWQHGDRILLNTMEFPANVYPYLNLQSKGVNIDFITDQDGEIPLETLEKNLTPNTRMLAMSAVQFLSGFRSDLKQIGDVCQKRDILFVVDGIQAVGAMDIDVEDMHIDALAAGGHKWQMAPQGIGFLYVSEKLQEQIQQKSLGWLSVKEPWQLFNHQQSLNPTARRYEGGTYNFPGIYGYQASLSTLLEFGIPRIEQRLSKLTRLLIRQLSDISVLTLYSPEDNTHRAGIVTYTLHDKIKADDLQNYLKKNQIIVAVREGKIRIAPHYYNTEEEIDELVTILKKYLVTYT